MGELPLGAGVPARVNREADGELLAAVRDAKQADDAADPPIPTSLSRRTHACTPSPSSSTEGVERGSSLSTRLGFARKESLERRLIALGALGVQSVASHPIASLRSTDFLLMNEPKPEQGRSPCA